jgi:hypothetical protein
LRRLKELTVLMVRIFYTSKRYCTQTGLHKDNSDVHTVIKAVFWVLANPASSILAHSRKMMGNNDKPSKNNAFLKACLTVHFLI